MTDMLRDDSTATDVELLQLLRACAQDYAEYEHKKA